MAAENGNGERIEREAGIVIGRIAGICLGVAGTIIGVLVTAWMGWATVTLMDVSTRMAVLESRMPSQSQAKAAPAPARGRGFPAEASAAEVKR